LFWELEQDLIWGRQPFTDLCKLPLVHKAIEPGQWEGYFAECGLRNAESCQGVICGKFDEDFFCGMKGKVQNESMRNVAKMNIY